MSRNNTVFFICESAMKIALVQPYHGCNHHPCIIAADGGLDDALVSACHRRMESPYAIV